jgi:hypothetical protein
VLTRCTACPSPRTAGRDGAAERLTFDHKPGDEGEKARIEALGGTVVCLRGVARLDGNLAVARSFGDLAFAPRLSVEPYTNTVALAPTDYVLVIACDGLWDVVTDQQAIDSVHRICSRGGDADLAAATLRDMALELRYAASLACFFSLLVCMRVQRLCCGGLCGRRLGSWHTSAAAAATGAWTTFLW